MFSLFRAGSPDVVAFFFFLFGNTVFKKIGPPVRHRLYDHIKAMNLLFIISKKKKKRKEEKRRPLTKRSVIKRYRDQCLYSVSKLSFLNYFVNCLNYYGEKMNMKKE